MQKEQLPDNTTETSRGLEKVIGWQKVVGVLSTGLSKPSIHYTRCYMASPTQLSVC